MIRIYHSKYGFRMWGIERLDPGWGWGLFVHAGRHSVTVCVERRIHRDYGRKNGVRGALLKRRR